MQSKLLINGIWNRYSIKWNKYQWLDLVLPGLCIDQRKQQTSPFIKMFGLHCMLDFLPWLLFLIQQTVYFHVVFFLAILQNLVRVPT